ncbi:hypothetical protein I6F07_21200 [Ensifer sp. IC4062]|nr:hypothetical protein [Ensifer sp. IC4062]MCA1442691.1 hypothetical protein [Ensifer sp. IC4062]
MQKVFFGTAKGVVLLVSATLKLCWLVAHGIFIGVKKVNAHNEHVAAKRHKENRRELTKLRLEREKQHVQDSHYE